MDDEPTAKANPSMMAQALDALDAAGWEVLRGLHDEHGEIQKVLVRRPVA
jgi:hypothetical protein